MSSVAFDKIVPLGQEFVLDDMPLTLALEERAAFFLCLMIVVNTASPVLVVILAAMSLAYYYICWIIRNPHNYLKHSCKGTNFQQT